MKNLKELLDELIAEAKAEGYHRSLYNHGSRDAFHTVEKRTQMLNHDALVEKIKGEILALAADVLGVKPTPQ